MRSLARTVGVALACAVGVVVVAGLARFDVHVAAILGLGALVGVAWWVVEPDETPRREATWPVPYLPKPGGPVGAPDITTRRIAAMLRDAQPDRGFTRTQLHAALTSLTCQRLRSAGALGPREGVAEAAPHLSATLANYLQATQPPALTRRTVRAYLKEIQQL